MKFWIVTPSYNQVEWLKLCVMSVADQATGGTGHLALGVGEERIEVHHHVQDACSSDGTVEWLECYAQEIVDAKEPQASILNPQALSSTYSFSFSSEKDEGMYDAINHGWKIAPDDVDVVAYLNCDEQYLPDALMKVRQGFFQKESAEILIAAAFVVDSDGAYICHRRSLCPRSLYPRVACMTVLTCTTFLRRSVLNSPEAYFDSSYKNVGDLVWIHKLVSRRRRFYPLHDFTSIFTDTGENLNCLPEATRESQSFIRSISSVWLLRCRPLINFFARLDRLVAEVCGSSFDGYQIYRKGDVTRSVFTVKHKSIRWKNTRKKG